MEQENKVVTGADTTPTCGINAVADEPTNEGNAPLQEPAFSLPVKYNKQEYQLSLDEATAYAQKGMKYESLEPTLLQLSALAKGQGHSLTSYLQHLCGGPVPDINERLADEFCRLQKRCPEVDTFDRLPASVVNEAVENGTPLLYAYLAHHYDETRRITRAEQDRAAATAASAGSQQGEAPRSEDPTVSAMIRGVRFACGEQ